MRRPGWTVAAAVVVGLGAAGCVEVVSEEVSPAAPPSPTAAPREPFLEQVGTIPEIAGQPYAVVAGVLAAAGTDELAGYQLPAGEPVWTVPLPPDAQVTQVSAGPDLVVVGYTHDGATHTMVVGPDGAERWQARGAPLATVADGSLLVTGAIDYASDFTEVDYEYVAYRADSGEQAWTVSGSGPPGPDLEFLVVGAPPAGPPTTRLSAAQVTTIPAASWLVLREEDGPLRVVEPDSGRLRPFGADRAVLPAGGVRLVADLALVSYWDGEPGSVDLPVAYDLATGEQRWTLDAVEVGLGEPPVDCGEVICLAGFVGAGQDRYDAYGLDPQTGGLVWTEDVARVVGPAAPGLPGSPLLALHHRILGADDLDMGIHLHDEAARLLDPGSGDVLLDLADWKPLGADGSWLLAYGYAELADVDWAAVTDQQVVDDLAVAVVDLDTRTVHELGIVPDVVVYQAGGIPGLWRFPQETYQGCRAAGGWLACQHTDGDLTVWRYFRQR